MVATRAGGGREKTVNNSIRYNWLIATALIIWLLYMLAPILTPFIAAGLLAYDGEADGVTSVRLSAADGTDLDQTPTGLFTLDGNQILHRKLKSETRSRKLLGKWRLERPAGEVTEVLSVEPGTHRFEALVESPDEELSLRGDIQVDLPAGEAGRLEIDLDRLFGDHLDLKWK